jgi:hypothetical protein
MSIAKDSVSTSRGCNFVENTLTKDQPYSAKRPSTAGRAYTPADVAWSIAEHHRSAATSTTGDWRIPMATFVANYNAHFAEQSRLVRSLRSMIDREPTLRAVRAGYVA